MVKNKYLRYIPLASPLASLFGTQRTRELFKVNPTITPQREEAKEVNIYVFDYDSKRI